MPLPEWILSLHYMKAVLPIARDGRLRRNKLINLESAFARLINLFFYGLLQHVISTILKFFILILSM